MYIYIYIYYVYIYMYIWKLCLLRTEVFAEPPETAKRMFHVRVFL